MNQVYKEMKDLYLDFYMETRCQERMIAACDYSKLNESLARRQRIISRINSLNRNHLIGKGEDINEILRKTLELEKKNKVVLDAALTDLRLEMKAFRNKKNNIMRYSMNG